ncbi:unnamed protein product, partial [Amoebophrya sp. A120]
SQEERDERPPPAFCRPAGRARPAGGLVRGCTRPGRLRIIPSATSMRPWTVGGSVWRVWSISTVCSTEARSLVNGPAHPSPVVLTKSQLGVFAGDFATARRENIASGADAADCGAGARMHGGPAPSHQRGGTTKGRPKWPLAR